MFERYSEKARRTIFFARYEASRLGGSEIGTEHILLGLFREDKAIVLRYLSSIPIGGFEEIRTKIEAISTRNPKLPTSADLPLSNESKRVLAYAAEEAERLAHPRIGNKHLLLGLLREERGCAAQLLRQYGAEVATLRLEMAKSPSKDEDVVYIHGSGWDFSYVNRVA
ncbi:MAG: ATP-dependent Clp protease ATP-binding subunit ClpC, partial [Acidobacteria bacterium]